MLYFCKVCELRYFTAIKTDKVLTIGKYLHRGAPVTLHMSIQAEVWITSYLSLGRMPYDSLGIWENGQPLRSCYGVPCPTHSLFPLVMKQFFIVSVLWWLVGISSPSPSEYCQNINPLSHSPHLVPQQWMVCPTGIIAISSPFHFIIIVFGVWNKYSREPAPLA